MPHPTLMPAAETRSRLFALALGFAAALAGCGGKPPPAGSAATPAPAAATAESAAPADAATAPEPLQATATTWSPEELENLLAPIALYPDPVLAQVLMSSTNPQEVLDAGNWLLQNQSLKGKALDGSAQQAGFTPSVRALVQFPQVMDMLCQDMSWTTELGQAYVNDQAGVLDAAQRLRKQAEDVGNLKSSEQMKVATVTEDGKDVVTITPPSPQVVYVPQYDPVAVYAAPPAAAAPATATTVVTEETGHSTGTLIATGLLSFGAGLLVANAFDDDDNHYYNSGSYWGSPPPYYPPPYRPRYGNGYYPSNGYNRPPGYNSGFNNNTVIINQNNNYWKQRNQGAGTGNRATAYKSPITEARPNRQDLQGKDNGSNRPSSRSADAGKVQGTYAGARPGGSDSAGKTAGLSGAQSGTRQMPKVQGSYAGARPDAGTPTSNAPQARPSTGSKSATAPGARPSPTARAPSPDADRGRSADTGRSQSASSPTARMAEPGNSRQASTNRGGGGRPTAMSGAGNGKADRAASQRGRQSMPQGAPARSGGGRSK